MELWDQSSTVDTEVGAYVYSLVNAVGGQSSLDDRYALGDDALAVLHDLLRWLRLYDEKTNRFDVKRCLAEANLVKGDLLEILALWPEEAQENKLKSKLALACLQLLVPLTWPMELDEEKTTVNHHRHMPYLQLAQVGYKRSILHYEDAQILRTAIRVALPAIAEPRRERSKRDEGVIRMMLYLFRNTAIITQPQHLPSQGDENEISPSATLEAFDKQDVFSLLLTIGSGANDEFQDQDTVVLETLFHLLKGIDPRKLFMEKEQLADQETNELQNLMHKEKAMLNSQNKSAPSRHNRFGTMLWVKRDDQKMSTISGQSAITNNEATLAHMDASKRVNKPKYRGKISTEFKQSGDFGGHIDISESARKPLRRFVEDVLDSSFNPLFSSLRKAIEREADRVSPSHHKQYFYLISWFLGAEAARREHKRGKDVNAFDSAQSNGDNMFAYIAAVLDQETFVLLNRHMQRALDEKSWQDLQAILLCFTRILLTVQDMTESKDEEDQEIAENIQNRIFYEEATHDRIVQILRGYTNQNFAYLNAVTECAHVFIRMLERYSKQNADLQIRSKRRARKKKKATQPNLSNADDAEEAEEEEQEEQAAASERKFDFARFSSKFLTQPCVDTFLALLRFYEDLNPEQLKRCHRYLYRLAFKNELAVLLFRADILQLLHRMIKGSGALEPAAPCFKDWEALIQLVFRRCIKWIERGTAEGGEGWREAAIVEMLFSKIPATHFYLQNGYERVVEKRPPRAPAELAVKASVKEEDRIAIAVGVLLEAGKDDFLQWVKGELKKAIEERKAWEEERTARGTLAEASERNLETEQTDAPDAPSIFLAPDTDHRKLSLFKDKHLRLLLKTLALDRLGTADDLEASWVFPSHQTSTDLQSSLTKVHQAEFDPPIAAQEQIRNKSAATVRHSAADFSDDGSASDDDDNALFPPNARQKRGSPGNDGSDDDRPQKKKRRLTRLNGAELTEEQLDERAKERRRKERERKTKIKSEQLVTALDDESDPEGDEEFFRLEMERRGKTVGIIKEILMKEGKNEKGQSGAGAKGKANGSIAKKGKRKADAKAKTNAKQTVPRDDEQPGSDRGANPTSPMLLSSDNSDSDSNSESDTAPARAPRKRAPSRDDEDVHMESAHSSPAASAPKTDVEMPLAEVSANAGAERRVEEGEEHDDDEDDAPVIKRGVRRRAGPFIVEEDSDEE